MIPVLTTERLLLRAPVMADFPAYAVHMASPRSVHEDGPFDTAAAWRDFASGVGQWALMGYGCWSIEARAFEGMAAGRFLGLVGINRPAHYPEDEIGWTLVEEAEGRGVAFEAALAARDWFRAEIGNGRLVSYIGPDNRRSIRLAERLGAVPDDTAARPEGDNCLVYLHPEAAA